MYNLNNVARSQQQQQQNTYGTPDSFFAIISLSHTHTVARCCPGTTSAPARPLPPHGRRRRTRARGALSVLCGRRGEHAASHHAIRRNRKLLMRMRRVRVSFDGKKEEGHGTVPFPTRTEKSAVRGLLLRSSKLAEDIAHHGRLADAHD